MFAFRSHAHSSRPFCIAQTDSIVCPFVVAFAAIGGWVRVSGLAAVARAGERFFFGKNDWCRARAVPCGLVVVQVVVGGLKKKKEKKKKEKKKKRKKGKGDERKKKIAMTEKRKKERSDVLQRLTEQ